MKTNLCNRSGIIIRKIGINDIRGLKVFRTEQEIPEYFRSYPPGHYLFNYRHVSYLIMIQREICNFCFICHVETDTHLFISLLDRVGKIFNDLYDFKVLFPCAYYLSRPDTEEGRILSYCDCLGWISSITFSETDWFMMEKKIPKPKELCIMQLPSLIGNFIAAEKTLYHKQFIKDGLMHGSTIILNRKEILQFMAIPKTSYQKEKESNKMIVKIPFSSSGHCVLKFSTQRPQSFGELAFQDSISFCSAVGYRWIVQKYNAHPEDPAPLEIRCFMVDGLLLFGIMAYYNVRILDKNYRFIDYPSTKRYQRVLEEHCEAIRTLLDQAWKSFHKIRIKKPIAVDDIFSMETEHLLSEKAKNPDIMHLMAFLSDPKNYIDKPITDRFLRIDIMYWPEENRFFVNEIETFACGKCRSSTNKSPNAEILKALVCGV